MTLATNQFMRAVNLSALGNYCGERASGPKQKFGNTPGDDPYAYLRDVMARLPERAAYYSIKRGFRGR